MFILLILLVIVVQVDCLFLISYASVTIALSNLTHNWFVKIFPSFLLTVVAGYLCLNITVSIFDSPGKSILAIAALLSFFFLRHHHFKYLEAKERKDHTTPPGK